MLNFKLAHPLAVAIACLAATVPASADLIHRDCAIPVEADGQIVTLEGTATAIDPSGCSRDLHCGSMLYGGETLSTGAGSHAGFLMGDVLAQMGPDSSAEIGTTPAGAPDLSLVTGSLRVIDPRESGPPVQLRAQGASAEFTGNDAGAAIGDDAAQFCADSPLPITYGGTTNTLDLGRCDTALAAGDLPLSGDTCLEVVSQLDLDPLPSVGSPPNGPPVDVPGPPEGPPRTPCEVGPCGPGNDSPPDVREQPPTETPFPGGGGSFPGGGGASKRSGD